MRYWLMKSEPDVFSIDHLKRDGRAPWDGVRNYQARNHMRDMKAGDRILFYHSSAETIGVAGIAEVAREAHPDPTAWNKKSDYFDPRSTPEKPLWFMVEVAFVEKFDAVVTLEALKNNPRLEGMLVLRRGQRLSVQPVSDEHFEEVRRMAGAGNPVRTGKKQKIAL